MIRYIGNTESPVCGRDFAHLIGTGNNILYFGSKHEAWMYPDMYNGKFPMYIEKTSGEIIALNSDESLFNASGDNTNFVFEVDGIDDDVMEHFNSLFREVVRKGNTEYDIATHDRMEYLKSVGATLTFCGTAKKTANDNLVRCGGKEMPSIIAGMVKHFYYDNFGGHTTVLDCIKSLAEEDVARYEFDNLEETYYAKVATFLYSSFTGLRLGTPWNGRADVNGGYIVLKKDGDVVAYHSTITDEFKDFLVHRLSMEGPSHKRHGDMRIEKQDGKYYLKLALQLRFSMNRGK